MQQITFSAPDSVEEACDALESHGRDAKVLAGGQSLVQMLKQRVVSAEHMIYIGDIPEFQRVRVEDDAIWIGAGVTYDDVRSHDDVRRSLPIVPEAIATIGDEQIRSRGTFVGGIAHADPQGDPPVVATALDATIRARSVDGEREISAPDFYQGLFETSLRENELVTEVGFRTLDKHDHSAYRSFAPRAGDFAIASVAVVLDRTADGEITSASVVSGSVADKPLGLTDVEALLEGETLDSELVDEATELAEETATVFGDEEWSESYKRSLIGTLLSDALTDDDR